MNSVLQLEREKGSLFIERQTLSFIIQEAKYKIKTETTEILENHKAFLIRKYSIPILFGTKFISEIIVDYVKLVQGVILLQQRPHYRNNPITKHFAR